MSSAAKDSEDYGEGGESFCNCSTSMYVYSDLV